MREQTAIAVSVITKDKFDEFKDYFNRKATADEFMNWLLDSHPKFKEMVETKERENKIKELGEKALLEQEDS